jgi:hypothetical protein
MKGVQYIVDHKGKPKAVVIDLKTHGELWEDFQDLVIAQQRLKEPRIPMAQVEAELRKKGKIA